MSITLWDGNPGNVSGSTPFGFYDDDIQFQTHATQTANYCARKLGYPIIDIELTSGSFYACFEESISEYSAQVNQFTIRDNILSIQGTPTSSNLTHKNLDHNMGQIIHLADGYGAPIGRGDISVYSSSICILAGEQTYTIIPDDHLPLGESGNLNITRIYHNAPPAIARFFDPYAGSGLGQISTINEFGWNNMSPAASFMLLPAFEDSLRLQSIEFSDMVRRSGYSFDLQGNRLKIWPIPTTNLNLWFDFTLESDLNKGYTQVGTMSDYSNATYNNMVYSDINDVGKQWIREYTLSAAKVLLGHIRSKYQSIPIPDSEVSLDGSDLISAGQEEQNKLIEQLRENLESMSNQARLEAKAAEAESLESVMRRTPLKPYWG